MPSNASLDDPTADKIAVAASYLIDSWRTGAPRAPMPPHLLPANLTEAYAIQNRLIEGLNTSVIGWKLAATNPAGQERFGVSEPFTGRLLTGAIHPSPAVLPAPSHPGSAPVLECEVGVIIDDTLTPDQAPFTQAMLGAIVHTVMPCFELPASRFNHGDVGLLSLVADNAGARAVVVGADADVASLAHGDIAVTLTVDGELVAKGDSGAALGSPIAAVAWLANHLAERNLTLEAGSFVLTGALTGAHRLPPNGRAVADFDKLGRVEVSFTETSA